MDRDPEQDRLPPHDLPAEQAVIACVLADPGESILACEEALMPGDFYDLRHRTIYETAVAMRDAGSPLDMAAVIGWHRNKGTLDQVGGISYLSELMSQATSAAGLGYHFESLIGKAKLRQLIRTCYDFAGRAHEPGEAPDLCAEFETAAMAVDQGGGTTAIRDTKEILRGWQTDFEAASTGSLPTGIFSGFIDLDRGVGGMMPQELIVIAGLPSSGKTSFAVNVAHHVAMNGVPVGIISLETSARKIILRMLAAMGQVKSSRFLTGSPTEGDMRSMIGAMARLSSKHENILVSDEGHSTKAKIASTMRRMHQRGCRLFVVDYLQLIQGSGSSEYERITDASKSMKMMAKELDCPVIVISAINREAGKREGKPRLSDLRGSGQIDFDADKVYMLWSRELTGEVRQVECHIVKNKDGETGHVNFTFFAGQFRFGQETVAIDDEDVPTQRHSKKPYRD